MEQICILSKMECLHGFKLLKRQRKSIPNIFTNIGLPTEMTLLTHGSIDSCGHLTSLKIHN